MRAARDLWETLRILWRLGGPLGVLLYKLDGSLERRVRELRR